MKHTVRWIKVSLAMAFAVIASGFVAPAQALDLPLSASSPLSGVAFDDIPLFLPVERNFQMAMLAVSSELGRSCGKMEAYGWRMNQTEQTRVDQIFNGTIDKLRSMAYVVAPESVKSGTKDITVFTADRTNKHLMFLWSANDLGLVLNICETGVPVMPTHSPIAAALSSVQVFPTAVEELTPAPVQAAKIKENKKTKKAKTPPENKKVPDDGFSPAGNWVGSYTCGQGYTGGTLEIEQLRGKDFTGAFRFYPTEKNPSVPDGYYTVFGQYDKESKRILINPGKWLRRPKGFYNTVLVGSFDPIKETFSAYFQGIVGCTSFEAVRAGSRKASLGAKKVVPAKQAIDKKKKTNKIIKKPTKKTTTSNKIKKEPVALQNAKILEDNIKDSGINLTPPAALSDTIPTTVMTPNAPTEAVSVPAAPSGPPPNTVPLPIAKPASVK